MQPALPFYLAEIGVVGREPIALWNGAINTAQFIAVVFGNIVWGLVGDHFGSAMAIRLAMAGDPAHLPQRRVPPRPSTRLRHRPSGWGSCV